MAAGPPKCDSAASCLALGETELRAPSHEGAVEAAFGRACELGAGEACFRLSHYLVLRGVERERINGLLDRGCEKGHLESCGIVGEALIEGSRGRTKDVARGMALYDKACGKGEARACVRLAEIHGAGQFGVAKNRKKEVAYTKKAKALGWKEN